MSLGRWERLETQSPVVFIQQLGRGLRKANGKEYVVILDFIGNYNNNFMIPIALSGDRTYNKDNIRRYIMEGGRVIPGASTVHFDEISRKRIFASVDNANFSDIKLIKENYTNLKNKLGRIPRLRDFDDCGKGRVFQGRVYGWHCGYGNRPITALVTNRNLCLEGTRMDRKLLEQFFPIHRSRVCWRGKRLSSKD